MTKIVSVYDGSIPMLSEVAALVQNHPLVKPAERNRKAVLVRKACRWVSTCAQHAVRVEGRSPATAETIPFTRPNLGRAFAQLAIAHLDVSKKSVDNTLSELNGIADLLGMPTGYAFCALSSECQAVQDRLVTKEDRGTCIRLLRVMSAHGISAARVADAVPHLREQIEADWKVERKDREFKRALYAWNKAAKLFPDLGLRSLQVPKTRKIWGLRWRDDLSMLEPSVDGHLALGDPRPEGDDIFAGPTVRPLGTWSKTGRKEAVRMAASALRDAKFDYRGFRHVRDICLPERYKMAMRVLVTRAGGVTSTVLGYGRELCKIAKLPDVLSASERDEVKAAFDKLKARHSEHKKAEMEAGRARDRGQELLDHLDDPAAMDAYLALAHRQVEAARRYRNPFGVGAAYAIMRALTLEIWHTVSWRIGVSVAWCLDQFIEVEIDGEKRIMVRAPKEQPNNKRTPDQYLSPEAATLYRLFIGKYRTIILRHNKCPTGTPYLFPGRGGLQRHPHTMRTQMNRWIRKHTGLDFHPHAIRKINPKLILDEDPTAIELAVRSGGWADDRMIRKIYGQKQHRKSQLKINEFVVGRRLRAISTVRKSKKRGSGKKPPEAA